MARISDRLASSFAVDSATKRWSCHFIVLKGETKVTTMQLVMIIKTMNLLILNNISVFYSDFCSTIVVLKMCN